MFISLNIQHFFISLCILSYSTFKINGFLLSKSYKVTNQVYFDVAIEERLLGRITIGLFGEIAPKTVRNFYKIATVGIDNKTYAGTRFHRVISRFMIQGGDIVNGDGSGSISIYGMYFDDETFAISHSGPGFVSMANSGKNRNGCQFFITTMPAKWLDGKHTVFGKVIQGQRLVHLIEHERTDGDDVPLKPVTITACGRVPTPKPFYVEDNHYDIVWAWIKASVVPMSFTLIILSFFYWVIRKLTAAEDTLESLNKRKHE